MIFADQIKSETFFSVSHHLVKSPCEIAIPPQVDRCIQIRRWHVKKPTMENSFFKVFLKDMYMKVLG